MIKVLIDDQKILGIGTIDYIPTGTQEVKEIADSLYKGQGKSKLKWVNNKLTLKTATELQAEIDKKQALQTLAELDKKVQRGLEDMFEALKTKGLITDSDMPTDFITNYNLKKEERLKI